MKDPAILLYIDKWLIATKLMPAHAKGWYLNLILVQYDRGGELPADLEDLALICDVRHSEFHLFKQTWDQVLKQKFKQLPNGCYQNEMAFEILEKREAFKEKRSAAGKIGAIVKAAKSIGYKEKDIELLKKADLTDLLAESDAENLKHMLKQMLNHLNKLYINEDVIVNEDVNEDKKAWFEIFWGKYAKKQDSKKCLDKWMKLTDQEMNAALDKVDAYVLSTPDVQFRKNPLTWLNGKCWNDEIIISKPTTKFEQSAKADLQSMIRYD